MESKVKIGLYITLGKYLRLPFPGRLMNGKDPKSIELEHPDIF